MTATLPRPPWTARYKENWDEAYQRVMAWWAGESLDRPVVLSPVPRADAPCFEPAHDPGTAEARDLDGEYQLAWHEHGLASHLFLAEAAPMVSTWFGSLLCMLATMAGAPVRYAPETGTVWIEVVDGLYERPMPEFSPDCPPYAFTIRMIHRYAEAFGYDAILGACPMVDPLTTLSMMRGPEALCLDLLDRPETVRRWCGRLSDLFQKIVAGYRAARAEHGRREEFNWSGIWAPGDMDAVQCDFSAMLSPAMFAEFAMPELEREAAFFDYALWHLDGREEICHLDAILSVPQIRAVQWADNPTTPALEYVELFRRIRSRGRSVLCSVRSVDEAVALTREVGKDGLAFLVDGIGSEGEMEAALERLQRV